MVLNYFKDQLLLKAVVGLTVWSFLLTSFIETIESLPGFLQFFIGTLGIYFFWGLILNRVFRFNEITSKEAIGGILLSAGLDNLAPPLSVLTTGVLQTSGALPQAAIDVQLFNLWSGLGFSGATLWALVYPISTIILLLAAFMLLNNRQIQEFVK